MAVGDEGLLPSLQHAFQMFPAYTTLPMGRSGVEYLGREQKQTFALSHSPEHPARRHQNSPSSLCV